MKTILTTTDFSEVSENAVKYAAELAELSHARLIIFHGYSVPMPVAEVPVMTIQFDELEKQNMDLLKALDKKLKAAHNKLETELLTRPGFVVDEIMELTKEKKVDLVVMGVTGSGYNKAILGSNTTSMMKKSKQSVIAVPDKAKFKKPGKIALACDYKAIVPDNAIEKFKEFVQLFKPEVLVFDVLKKAELVSYEKVDAEVNLENSLVDIDHSIHFITGENLEEEVNRFVEVNNVDMLVVMPHNYNFFAGLVHRSGAKKIALNAHVPILSIHE